MRIVAASLRGCYPVEYGLNSNIGGDKSNPPLCLQDLLCHASHDRATQRFEPNAVKHISSLCLHLHTVVLPS